MTLWSCIYQIIIGPISLLIETVYGASYQLLGSIGGAIIPLSLAVNFLLIPLYRRADVMQKQERTIQLRMAPRLKEIKQAFRGDERFMMQQAL